MRSSARSRRRRRPRRRRLGARGKCESFWDPEALTFGRIQWTSKDCSPVGQSRVHARVGDFRQNRSASQSLVAQGLRPRRMSPSWRRSRLARVFMPWAFARRADSDGRFAPAPASRVLFSDQAGPGRPHLTRSFRLRSPRSTGPPSCEPSRDAGEQDVVHAPEFDVVLAGAYDCGLAAESHDAGDHGGQHVPASEL